MNDLMVIILPCCSALITVGIIYGTIRSDLKNMHENFGRINQDIGRVQQTADACHRRLDEHLIHHASSIGLKNG